MPEIYAIPDGSKFFIHHEREGGLVKIVVTNNADWRTEIDVYARINPSELTADLEWDVEQHTR